MGPAELGATCDGPGPSRWSALASYTGRYAQVAEQAAVSIPAMVAFDVVERVPGGPATAFAAPECRRPFPQVTGEAERATVTPAAARRLAGQVTAAWATFDQAAATSPAELRKAREAAAGTETKSSTT